MMNGYEKFSPSKSFLVLGSLAVLMSTGLATQASAQSYDPNCIQANSNNNTTGTLLGGLAGAVIGSAVSGRHSRGEGAVIGGLGGALVGNQIAQSNSHPCPAGYYYQAPPPPPPAAAYYRPPRAEPGDFWYGAPDSIVDRIRYLQDRVDYANRDGYISPRELRRLNSSLQEIRREEADIRYRYGYVSGPDGDRLWHKLNGVSARLQKDQQEY